jgi:peptide/nickel transport system substrate-binding protein
MRYLNGRHVQRAALLLALALVFAACGGGDTATTGSETTGTTGGGQASGTVRVAWETPPETFAPGNDQPDGFVRIPLETLVWRTAANPTEFVPMLATSWVETDQDLTLTLRQGVKFHDGSDFNADAVVKNFQFVIDQAGPFSAPLVALSKIEAVDQYTVRLTKGEPNPALLVALTSRAGLIACPAALDDGSINLVPCGTGPWKYNTADSVAGTTWVFDSFDGYYDPAGVTGNVKRLEMTFISDASARVGALIAGEVDIEDQDMASISQTKSAGFSVYVWPALHYAMMMVDRGPGGVLEDVNVRRAVCQGVDPVAVARSGGTDFFTAVDQRYSEGQYGYNPDIKGYTFSEEAATFLRGLGLKLDMAVFAANQSLGEALAGEYAKVGVELSVQSVTPGEYFGGWYANWKIGSGDNSEPDPYDWYQTWFAADGPNNISGVESPELKAAADAAIAAGASPEAEALWQNVMLVIHDEALACLHQAVNQGYGYDPKVVENIVGFVGMPGFLDYRVLRVVGG